MPENIFSGIVMLLVAAMTSALATKTKRQEELRREAEKEKVRADLLRSRFPRYTHAADDHIRRGISCHGKL